MHVGWLLASSFVAFAAGAIIGDLSFALRLAGRVHEAFSDTKTAVATTSAVAALLALLVQVWVGSRQAKVGMTQAQASQMSAEAAMLTARHAGDRAIATMRLGWVEKVRSVLSEYHAILVSKEVIEGDDRIKVCDLGTQLDLLLNRDNPSQKALWEIADKIFDAEDLETRKAIDDLVKAGRLVMKEEWDKIKNEQRGQAVTSII